MKRKVKNESKVWMRGIAPGKVIFVLIFFCFAFLIPIQGQENIAGDTSQIERKLKHYQLQAKANETEILRMKLAMEQDRSKLQLLVIALGVVFSIFGASFTVVLFVSRKQIRKKNALLMQQNQEIQIQNSEIMEQREEIILQAEQLTLKNEFLLEQYEHLAELNLEKDGLIGIVAHDLRTPINQSKGFAELLKSTGLNHEQQVLVNMITRVNDEGLHLISDLLQINSMAYEKVESTLLRLDQFFHTIIEVTFKPIAEKKSIGLHLAVEKDLIIATHPQYLKRILENLVSNALKFSNAGSLVSVRVLSTNDSVYISVEDHGPGISEEDQKKMFRKFQKLSARPTSGESSTGLGLAIVKGLVEKLQGELQVKSELGKGSTFILKLNKTILNSSETDEMEMLAQLEG